MKLIKIKNKEINQLLIDKICKFKMKFWKYNFNSQLNFFYENHNSNDLHFILVNNNRILAVRIYVLARSILPDNKYTNTNTYTLGDLPVTFDDHYRRLLFNSTVTLYNAGVDSW